MYKWNDSPNVLAGWIDEAFERRDEVNPGNSFIRFSKTGEALVGIRKNAHRRIRANHRASTFSLV